MKTRDVQAPSNAVPPLAGGRSRCPHPADFRELLASQRAADKGRRPPAKGPARAEREPEPERPAVRFAAPATLPSNPPNATAGRPEALAETQALLERHVASFQLGRIGRTGHVARLRLGAEHGDLEVRLELADGALTARLVGDAEAATRLEPRIRDALAARGQTDVDIVLEA